MSTFEFVIPLKKETLLECHAGQYYVEDVVQPRLLLSKLQDAARAYNSDGVDYILEHFDTYFSIIVHGTHLEWNLINKGFDHILRTTKGINNCLEPLLQDNEINSETRTKYLNITKMTLYLHTQIMKTKDAKLAADNSTKLTLGKKGKKATDNEEFCEWTESDKQAALISLYTILQQPLSRLWDPPLAEDNFVSMVSEPCYVALEEQIIKNKTVREIIFQILGVLIKKYNHGTSCIIKLVQVLQRVEHTISPICAGVVQLTRDFGLGTFAPQMNSAGTEQAAARNCGTFLLELTKELPKEMTGTIATLQPYLETDESYTLRISVLGMMCEILSVELTGEGLDDRQKIQRDDFLDDLYEHIHDLSAYVRHKVLQYWARLQKDGCIPVTRQRIVMERAIGRLRDKAALVRKAAIQLIKLELLEEQLATESKILDDLQKKLNPGPDPVLVKKWEKIEADVIKTINDKIDTLTQDEPDLSQATIQNLYETIRKSIHEKNYYKAYLIVKHTERQYPDAKLMRCDMPKSDQCENELALHKRLEEKESIVAFLQESVHFSKMISEAVPVINSLLMSKQAGDVSEAIDFFTAAYHFNIESAKIGVANMLILVWSPDQSERARAYIVARKLVSLCAHVDRGAALALEDLVDKWLAKGDVTPAIIQVFWEMFLKKIDGTTDMDSYAALSLLVMIAKAKPSVVLANLEVIQTHGLTGDYNSRNLCAQLLLSLSSKGQRYPDDNPMFTSLVNSLLETYATCDKFISFAANSIDFIYAVCDTPENLCTRILSAMYKKIEENLTNENEDEISLPVELLTRFIFVLGHVALQQLIYLDISVYRELRRRNQVREERKAEEKRKKKFATPKRGRIDDLRRQTVMNLSNASASSRGARSASVTSKTQSVNTTMTEEEGGLEGAVADDADAEYVRTVCERDIVGAGTSLARYVPLLRALLTGALMVTVLKKSKNVALRTNLTIAFSDLTLRFPNLTQPWTHHIYHILSDEELDVRQCAVKMLSFLVLHEMVRVKGQIADMALCCADSDARVANMTKVFFKQLSQKGNALYNVMPDIISRLSDPELNRFKLSTEERQWRDLAYCLSLFTYNERSLKKLIENIDCYKDKLHCKGVMDCFSTLMNNASKNAKNEIKTLVTELGDKIEEHLAVRDEESGNAESNKENEQGNKESEPSNKENERSEGTRATPRRKPAPRRQRDEMLQNIENTPSRSMRKSKRKVAAKTKSVEDSDESDDEDFQKKDDEVFKKPISTRKGTRRRN
ncbi:unnamed protein product [Leptidea sinapis]|uniref:Condensin complex subunit 1 n=1 Tax=Leptidea sinapis TaxID=189913 RepID=A0A5E4PYX6_9NEOP|nr:unnamed protein product [Leptidea sinapis]